MANVNKNEIGFQVVCISKAAKANHVVAQVRFDGSQKDYTYVRKNEGNQLIIDGCRVKFSFVDDVYEVTSVERIYETTSKKRTKTNGNNANKLSDKIKEDIAKLNKTEVKTMPVSAVTIEVVDDEMVEATPENVAEVTEQEAEEVNGRVVHEKYWQIRMCIENKIPVYLAGPAGSGKNHTVAQVAEDLDMDFFFSNSVQHEYKLTGFIDAGGAYHETEFYKACTNDKDCVFFLDEMDASIPDVLVLLNAAIANGYFEFPTGRVDFDHVHFVSAGNTVGNGADDMYSGRMVIDQATLDRFAIIEFSYSIRIEKAITKNNMDLINFVHQLRDEAEKKGIRTTFSYRCMIMMRKLENKGMSLQVAMKIAVVKGLDKDTINTLNPIGDSKYHKALREVKVAA